MSEENLRDAVVAFARRNDMKKTTSKEKGAIPNLPKAPTPPAVKYPPAPDCAPHERAERLLGYLGKRDDIPPTAVGELAAVIRDYEAIIEKCEGPRIEKDNAEFIARETLKSAGFKFAEAIKLYESAAAKLMEVDFNRGLTVAQWAKALRVRQQEQQLEGA
jgi:hypothetical protein